MDRRLRSLLLPVVTAVALLLGLTAAPATAAPPPGRGTPVTVMTRNLYLGADINRPIDAVDGLTGVPALLAFAHANEDVRRIVAQTDFPDRAKLLAREIATRKPDLVGLQEAALWQEGPLELPPSPDFAKPNAQTVVYDFLDLLEKRLADLGQPYVAVSVQKESDVEGPAFAALPTDADAADVRLTMRDVVLKRVASDVTVLDEAHGQYTARITLSLAGVPFSFIRGWNSVDVRAGAKQFRFVNTHLESASSYIALAQAGELLAGPAAVTDRPVVVVCDCNSDPLNGTTKPTDPVPTPHWAPYRLITGAGGFADEWLQWAPAEQGFTSGLNEFVNDPDLSAIDHRIDMVFGRAAGGGALPVDRGWITGGSARTPDGLWASDHLGVAIRLRP